MARKLSSKDLFEQEDIFKGVRESAQSTLKTLEGLEGQLKGVAEGLKAAVSSMKLDSSKGLKEFTQLTEQSNDLVKESIELAKLKAEAEQQERKAEQELLKVQKLKNQEAERQQRAAEKEQRAAEKRIKQQKDQESAYKQIAAATRDLKTESKELGAQLLQMQKAGKQGTAEFDSLKQRFDSVTAEAAQMDQELKDLDATVGDFFRNVGNYKSATEDLSNAFNELGNDTGDVSLKFEEVYGEIQPLTSRLGEAEDRLYELALAGKENTEQYQKLLEEVVKYRKAQIKTDSVVDQSAQTMSQKLGGSLTAVAGGFEIATAGMTLFGVESEGVANAILKIQQVMALTDGIKNIQENINSVKSLGTTAVNAVKNMSGAMMGLVGGGIGLAITGLVLLANKLTAKSKEREKIENDIEKNRENQKKLLADELEKVRLINDLSKQKLNTLDKQYNRLIKIAQAQGKVVEAENLDMELKKKKVDQLRANREDTRKQLSDVTEEMEIINKELQTLKRSSMG